MKNLISLPNEPTYLDRYISIRDRKHEITRAPLVAAHALIEGRYEAYAQAIRRGALASLAVQNQALQLRDKLRACYDGSTKPLKELKKAIQDAQPLRLLKYCPMCGTTLPGTFDHYMPAVSFPEFAVHPLNLVPCCARCNSTKDDDWLSNEGKRQYLHGYTDHIPDLQFVFVRLFEVPELDCIGANFTLDRPAAVAQEMWELIDSHFRRLKLIERYDELGNNEVAEILSTCRVHLDAGGQNIHDFLSALAIERIGVYGRNHWIAVLMNGMAQHPKLGDWVGAARR